jgi:hypothetical protein
MNNLFRITKDNVNNFFIEYSKNKQNNELNHKNKTKSTKIIKEQYDNLNQNQNPNPNPNPNQNLNVINKNMSKYLEQNDKIFEHIYNEYKSGQQIQSIKANFNYEKKQNAQVNSINKEPKFNCKIKKAKTDTKTINQIMNNKQNVDEIKDNLNQDYNDEKKIMFEYGRSGIKVDRLKKSMKYNLNELSSIDNMIKSFLDFNPKLKLNTILLNNKNESDIEKKIYWNSDGQINIEKNIFLNVNINDKKNNNKYKKYNLIDFGYIKIYDITFTEEFINKYKIPSLNSIITFSDNIKHFLKLIKLFEHTDQYKIKINQFGNHNLRGIFLQHLPSIILNINEKKNLFNSTDNKFTFYIKITQTKTTAFIIDKEEKIMCYLNSIEKNLSGYIFFYIIALDSKYKIINLNKLNLTEKDNVKIKKNNQHIKKVKSSEISDFSDSNDFIKPQDF